MAREAVLYYVFDPMCSWCYGYAPVWAQLKERLPENVRVQYVLGGLAADSDEPMPEATRTYVQAQWRKVMLAAPGTEFNFEFWEKCTPKRSTYPACRAVMLARQSGRNAEIAMLEAIQRAYYREAKNPSDSDTLIALAETVGLNVQTFAQALNAAQTQQALAEEIHFARSIGGEHFPSLFFTQGEEVWPVPIDYRDATPSLAVIAKLLAE